MPPNAVKESCIALT
ncbi:hypothetical protein YPPY01_3049, partial [Yersinia pestis PY-01]